MIRLFVQDDISIIDNIRSHYLKGDVLFQNVLETKLHCIEIIVIDLELHDRGRSPPFHLNQLVSLYLSGRLARKSEGGR